MGISGEKEKKKRTGEGEIRKVIAMASFEKHKGGFELNVLAMVPLSFVVGREAELVSESQAVGVWKRMSLLFCIPQTHVHVSVSVK